MSTSFLNLITIIAFTALAGDLLLQIYRVWTRKHSADVSIIGECIRVLAAIVIFMKLAFVGDPYLIIGQVVLVLLLVIYVALLFRYRKNA